MTKTLAIYLMSGPDTPELAEAAVEGGADLVELGFPFSDPLADGPVVRRAAEKALAQGMRTRACLECLAAVRERVEVPLVPMTYSSLLEAYGWERFAEDARSAGAASLIVADLPAGDRPGLRRVQLVAPTSTDERLRLAGANTDGWLYLVTVTGTTGARTGLSTSLAQLAERARIAAPGVPLYAGFGISTPADARAAAELTDGVVVGSQALEAAEARTRVAAGIRPLAAGRARLGPGTYPESATVPTPRRGQPQRRSGDSAVVNSHQHWRRRHVRGCTCSLSRQGGHTMGKIEPLAPSKRVRIVLCSAAFAIAAIVPTAGFAADWSSGVTKPAADWSSEAKDRAEQGAPTGRPAGSLRRPTGALVTRRARSARTAAERESSTTRIELGGGTPLGGTAALAPLPIVR